LAIGADEGILLSDPSRLDPSAAKVKMLKLFVPGHEGKRKTEDSLGD
jgi:hypothetical protein